MKTYNKYIALAAMALTFAACTQEDDFTPQTDGDAVKINATIGKLQTRVAYEDDGTTNFINGDEICVQNILRESKNIATYTYTNNGTYNDPNMAWTTTNALVWNGGTAESQFQAWYPATASFDKFTLPTLQNDNERLATADWMTASTSAMVKPDDKTINLTFEHKLAKITVQITEFTSQFGEDAHLFPTTTIYSLRDEYVTVNGGIKPIVRSNSATAIVCPGKYAPGSKLMEITISEPTGETYLDVPVNAFLTDTGLEAGKHYTFNLTVGKNAAVINRVSVTDWIEKDIEGGVAEEDLSNTIDATTMSADALNAAVTNLLSVGHTNITVTLAADAPVEMITAIRRALRDTEGVADGSINLTLKGVTAIPDHSDNVQDKVLELNSINLPDVVTIGKKAFYGCENLVFVTAPKVQTIGEIAFAATALTSVEFPELTTIPNAIFNATYSLSSAKFPKVTTIESHGLLIGALFTPEAFLLELTAEGDITFNGESHFNVSSQNYSDKVDLVLHKNKEDQVTKNDDGTATWQVRDDLSYTFKSITFVGE